MLAGYLRMRRPLGLSLGDPLQLFSARLSGNTIVLLLLPFKTLLL